MTRRRRLERLEAAQQGPTGHEVWREDRNAPGLFRGPGVDGPLTLTRAELEKRTAHVILVTYYDAGSIPRNATAALPENGRDGQ